MVGGLMAPIYLIKAHVILLNKLRKIALEQTRKKPMANNMDNKERNSAVQKDEVNKFRVSAGLPPIKEGNRICLKCDREFLSTSKIHFRMCERCRKWAAEQ